MRNRSAAGATLAVTGGVRSRLVAGVVAVAALAAGCGGTPSTGVATAPLTSGALGSSGTVSATGGDTATPDQGPVTMSAQAPVPSSLSSPSPVAFSACMRSNGVPTFPDPDSSGAIPKPSLQQLGVTALAFQSAASACHDLLPVNVAPGPRPTPDVAQALRFAQCMRGNGEPNFPDPAGDGRIPDPATVGIDQGSAVYEAANDACAANRPPYLPSNAEFRAWASAQP